MPEGDLAVVTIESAGEIFLPLAVNYCPDPDDPRTCEYQNAEEQQAAERLHVPPLGAFLVNVAEPVSSQVSLILFDSSGIDVLSRDDRSGAALLLYTPPVTEFGSYIFAVEVRQETGTATYYFQIVVTDVIP
jgi:hypothetical protein